MSWLPRFTRRVIEYSTLGLIIPLIIALVSVATNTAMKQQFEVLVVVYASCLFFLGLIWSTLWIAYALYNNRLLRYTICALLRRIARALRALLSRFRFKPQHRILLVSVALLVLSILTWEYMHELTAAWQWLFSTYANMLVEIFGPAWALGLELIFAVLSCSGIVEIAERRVSGKLLILQAASLIGLFAFWALNVAAAAETLIKLHNTLHNATAGN